MNLLELKDYIQEALNENNLLIEVRLQELMKDTPKIVKDRSKGYDVTFRISFVKDGKYRYKFIVKKPGTKAYNVNFEFLDLDREEKIKKDIKNANERSRYWKKKASEIKDKKKKSEYLKKSKEELDKIEDIYQDYSDDMLDLDVRVSCTCGYFKFWGPDYNARQNDYSLRKMSNLQPPDIRDPNREHNICKHIYAASKVLVDYLKSSKD